MKSIEWLDNFAENYKKMSKTASKKAESIIVDKSVVKEAKVGDVISYNNKTYKVANIDYVDDKGPGAVLDEVGYGEGISSTDPMTIAMGINTDNINTEMTEQEYSRTNPGDIYDVPVEEHYEEDARATEQQIANENSKDRTTVENHYSTNDSVSMVEKPVAETPVEDIIEQSIDEEVSTEDEETPIENEETSTEDEVVDFALVNETIETDEIDDEFNRTSKRHNRILRRIMASK